MKNNSIFQDENMQELSTNSISEEYSDIYSTFFKNNICLY